MADDEQVEQAEERKPSIIGKLVPVIVTVLVPVILALLVLKLFVLPMLAENVEDPDNPVMPIDPMERTLRFEMPPASVITEADDPSRPLLQYTIVVVCSSQVAADLITMEEDRFLSKISEIHRNRTQKLLEDPAFQDYLATQTQEELNTLLRRLRPNEDHEVRDVSYLQFTVLQL